MSSGTTSLVEKPSQFEILLESTFELKQRKTTIRGEIFAGFIHYVSCVFILPVVSGQLGRAGYDAFNCCVITLAMMSLGSIVGGIFSNLPFVFSPAASIFIYLSFALRQRSMGELGGNQAVAISGFCMMALFFRPFLRFLVKLIPQCIQVSTAIGVGLITALAGCLNVNLIVQGKNSVGELGPINAEVRIAIGGFIIVALLRYFKIPGSFLIVLIFNSVVYWAQSNTWQAAFAGNPRAPLQQPFNHHISQNALILAGELFFLYILILNGMSRGFCELAGLINAKKQSVPRVRWIYLWCGVCTVVCGFFGGPPIVISPECGPGILAGGKTGLSAVVAGILFGFTTFISPMLKQLPGAAIAPLLMTLGVVTMVNAKKIDFMDIRVAWPAYIVLFLVPFAFDIVDGVIYGWLVYLILHLFSGDLYRYAKIFVGFYSEALLMNVFVNWLDLYVPGYWLLDVSPPNAGALPVVSPTPANAQPTSRTSAATMLAGVISNPITELELSSATKLSIFTDQNDFDSGKDAANLEIGVRPTQVVSRPSQAPARGTSLISRKSSQLIKKADGSYAVDWNDIRKSMWMDLLNENEEVEAEDTRFFEGTTGLTAVPSATSMSPATAGGYEMLQSLDPYRATWC